MSTQCINVSRLQSQLPEKGVMVSKVQPELLRQVSLNKLLGANSMALQSAGVAAHSSQVIQISCDRILGLQLSSLFAWLYYRYYYYYLYFMWY